MGRHVNQMDQKHAQDVEEVNMVNTMVEALLKKGTILLSDLNRDIGDKFLELKEQYEQEKPELDNAKSSMKARGEAEAKALKTDLGTLVQGFLDQTRQKTQDAVRTKDANE